MIANIFDNILIIMIFIFYIRRKLTYLPNLRMHLIYRIYCKLENC